MTRLVYVPNRILDLNGVADGASVTVYQSGTTTKINLYADSGCTIPVANPYTVAAGAAFPAIYYNYVGNIRVYIVSNSGEIQDEDPYYSIILTTEVSNYAIAPITTRTALAALASPVAGQTRYLEEAGREGIFVFDASNNATNVTADPSQGIYIAPSSDSTGASGAWVRHPGIDTWKQATWWGMSSSASAAANAIAGQAAIDAIYALGGGVLLFPDGSCSHTGLTFKNKIQYKGHGRDIQGTKGTTLLYTGTGDGVQVNNPINSSTSADYSCSDITFKNQTVNAGKGSFADTGSSQINFHRCTFSGSDRGLILDQSELADVTECDFEIPNAAVCGMWFVNGADRNVGASSAFTNRISVNRCQFNGGGTGIGVLDEGGYTHSFINNNYNGCQYHIRASGVESLQIIGGQWEGSTGPCLLMEYRKRDGVTGVGACTGTSVMGGFMTPAVGQPAISVVSGSLQVDGGWQCSTSVAGIQGTVNAGELSLGWVLQRGSGTLSDGWGITTHLSFSIASAAPASNYHRQGEIVWNNGPTTGTVLGWRCTVSGTPGTWETINFPVPSVSPSFTGDFRYDGTGGHDARFSDSSSGAGTSYLSLRGIQGFPEIHVRPAAGIKGVISWAEDSVANRWSQGILPGDGNYYLSAGDFVLGNVKFTYTPAGVLNAVGGYQVNGTTVFDSSGILQAAAIANNTVTYAKMQDVSATSRFIGRITAGAGDPEELTGTQATTLLDTATSGLKGLMSAQDKTRLDAEFGWFRTILDCSGFLTAADAAGTYGMAQGQKCAITGTGTQYPLNSIYLAAADFPAVGTLNPKLRIRVMLHCNDVAPGVTFTIGLHPITRPATSGGAGLCIYTIGTAVASSTVAIATPAADSSNVAQTAADFALPADGHYVIGVVTSGGALAASSHVHISTLLQLHYA